MPKLSIITINLNNASGLQKTMESLFGQTFMDFEYIVIDGDSTDGSKALIQNNLHKLSYWVSEKDKGIYNAMNKGIVKATGEYILFMNSGDYLYSSNTLKDVFEHSNNEDIIYGDAMVDRGDVQNEVKFFPANLTFKYFMNRTLHHTSAIIKTDLFNKHGLYNEGFKIMSDWEFFIKTICLYQASYKYINQIISCFNPDGISSQISSGQLKLDERAIVLNRYFGAFLPDYNEADENLNTAISRLRLYNSSRLHNMIEKFINLPLYKSLKKL